MKFLIVAVMALTSFSSFANVKVIKSRINGTAVELNSGILNILNPTITIDGKAYTLAVNHTMPSPPSGIAACNLLNMDYVNYDFAGRPEGETAVYINDGAFNYSYSNAVISVLTCKQRIAEEMRKF